MLWCSVGTTNQATLLSKLTIKNTHDQSRARSKLGFDHTSVELCRVRKVVLTSQLNKFVANSRRTLLTLSFVLSIGSVTAVANATEVAITFSLNAGDYPLECGKTYPDVGSTSAEMSLQDARLYVSNFRFVDASGSETEFSLVNDGMWQNNGLALLDFEDATGACNGNPIMNKKVHGEIPDGDYVGLAFDVGVPESMNHQDPTLAAPPLNLSALSWPWRNGYKYTTFDLETAITSGGVEGAPGFSVHIGATNCGDGSPMRAPSVACELQNRPAVLLDAFDPTQQIVVIDLAALLAETDITTNQPQTPSGCMAAENDTDCHGIFRRAGLRDSRQQFVRAQ